MKGIKEIMGLVYWMDNSKQQWMEASLANQRHLSKEKVSILKELADEDKNKVKKLKKQ